MEQQAYCESESVDVAEQKVCTSKKRITQFVSCVSIINIHFSPQKKGCSLAAVSAYMSSA